MHVPLRRVGAALRAGGGATNHAGKPRGIMWRLAGAIRRTAITPAVPAGVPDPPCLSQRSPGGWFTVNFGFT